MKSTLRSQGIIARRHADQEGLKWDNRTTTCSIVPNFSNFESGIVRMLGRFP
jgi:hypothetical protein